MWHRRIVKWHGTYYTRLFGGLVGSILLSLQLGRLSLVRSTLSGRVLSFVYPARRRWATDVYFLTTLFVSSPYSVDVPTLYYGKATVASYAPRKTAYGAKGAVLKVDVYREAGTGVEGRMAAHLLVGVDDTTGLGDEVWGTVFLIGVRDVSGRAGGRWGTANVLRLTVMHQTCSVCAADRGE